MREIVHIQAGQCGNQIGAKVSPTPHATHEDYAPPLEAVREKWISATAFEQQVHREFKRVARAPNFGGNRSTTYEVAAVSDSNSASFDLAKTPTKRS